MTRQLKSFLSIAAKLSLAVILIVWLVKSDKLDFAIVTRALNFEFVALGLAAVGTSLAFGVERWRRFLCSQGIELSFLSAYKLSLIGIFFNFVMPGGVGGDLIKGYYIAKESKNTKIEAAFTVLLDRLIGLLAIALISLVVMLFNWDLIRANNKLLAAFYLVIALNLLMLFIWSVVFSNRFHQSGLILKIISYFPKAHYFERLYRSLSSYRDLKHVFFTTLGLSLLAQFASLSFFILAGKAMGFSLPISTYLVAIPITFVIQAVPISPGGIGVGQTATFFLFELLNTGSGVVGSATTTAHQMTLFLFGIIGAILYVGLTQRKAST